MDKVLWITGAKPDLIEFKRINYSAKVKNIPYKITNDYNLMYSFLQDSSGLCLLSWCNI